MSIFALLDFEKEVQLEDKTRLDASKSFAYFVDGLPFMPFVYPSGSTVNKSSFMPFFWGI